MAIELTPEELVEVFGGDDPTQHAEEAERRWGDTEAWAESKRRTAGYGKDDWLRIKAEGADISAAIVAVYQAGEHADSVAAMGAVEAHRLHICRWFYDCPRSMQVELGEMYVADPRFAEHYESQAEGLAQYVHDAIVANAARS